MRSKVKGRKLIYRREENDDSNNRRILYLLFILLLTGILLSTTTYAWFTTNRMVSVNSLDVKVNAAGGIEIGDDVVAGQFIRFHSENHNYNDCNYNRE